MKARSHARAGCWDAGLKSKDRSSAGEGRGRNVTVPTLNLEPENELVPRAGVYITRTAMDSGDFVDSITNIGTRPTFNGSSQTIETFVLNAPVPSRHRAGLGFSS